MAELKLIEALSSIISNLPARKLARKIDSTLLSQTSSVDKALSLIEDASGYGFKCVMLPPPLLSKVYKAADQLGVNLCTVIGFPSGFQPVEAKVAEIKSVAGIVDEIDIVAPLWAAGSGALEYVINELKLLVDTARDNGIKIVKVIIEAPILDDTGLELMVNAVAESGADFVKTSTGVYTKGGDPNTVMRVARIAIKKGLLVKAAGGIRTGLDALLAVAAGADRIGTSRARDVLLTYAKLTGEQL